ncbi:MAG: class I adenylate cyclase [Gammaproteobacteria bacterium]|nr:class I adenylate cyclase [Gammaproteobacteria bacterium]
MKVKNDMQVVDARQAYYRCNSLHYDNLADVVGDDVYKYIQLIPLFLQINNKLLPGNSDDDVPVGIYSYKPDNKIINNAKKLNSKFRYQQEGVVKNYAIDAIYFKQTLIDNSHSCWILYRTSLNEKQISALKNKINKISDWLLLRGANIDFIVSSVDEFKANNNHQLTENNISMFLDEFYSEVILLAGKYPVWWLVPPHKENDYAGFVEHIKQARFVDIEEFVDLGSVADYKLEDLISSAVAQAQKSKKSPELCLINLLIIDEKNMAWPEFDGISIRIKSMLYKGGEGITAVKVYANFLKDAFNRYSEKSHILSPIRLFSRMRNISENVNHSVIDAYLKDDYVHESSVKGLDSIVSYLNFFKAISFEIRQVFTNIVNNYNAVYKNSEGDKNIKSLARNTLVFLSDDEDKIALYNNKNEINIVLDRIHLKQNILNGISVWSLVLEVSEGDEKTVDGFSSLLGILAWCWLNRIVNNSTQVSVECPNLEVKQIEAFFVLETLIHYLKPDLISNIPPLAFENPLKPIESLLFINFMAPTPNTTVNVADNDDALRFSNQASSLITHCEQLIVNSWGDVYTRQYSGNTGLLRCLCEWTQHAPIDSMTKPQLLKVFGHGIGDSTYMAQRVEQIYEEMLLFFYHQNHENGRFILRMGIDYHVIKVIDSLLIPEKIGKQKSLMKYLELASTEFQITALERLAYTDHPLREIYHNNKRDVFQIFFQIINRKFNTWVLDEKGTLWSDLIDLTDRESYITHWLYLFRNIRNRLQKINYQDKEFPALEINQISNNLLGGVEFYPLGADSITGDKNFIDIKVHIFGHQEGDQLSIICDGRKFSYSELKQDVLADCVQYMSSRMLTDGHLPVYVTDIDVPLRIYNVNDRDEIQISHILKFKRNFEHRINKLLESL